MRLGQHLRVRLGADANQEAASPADRAAHAAVHHKAQPAHQLLLDDVAPIRQHLAYPHSRFFVVGHRSSLRFRFA
jgi:hypothetical protein